MQQLGMAALGDRKLLERFLGVVNLMKAPSTLVTNPDTLVRVFRNRVRHGFATTPPSSDTTPLWPPARGRSATPPTNDGAAMKAPLEDDALSTTETAQCV